MKTWLHPEALEDLSAGRNYYRDRVGVALAQNFVNEFERVAHLLMQYPDFGTSDGGDIRKHPLRRFPFSVVYRVLGDELRILAVAHQSRKPRYWRSRS